MSRVNSLDGSSVAVDLRDTLGASFLESRRPFQEISERKRCQLERSGSKPTPATINHRRPMP
jgi:hypothetical protein